MNLTLLERSKIWIAKFNLMQEYCESTTLDWEDKHNLIFSEEIYDVLKQHPIYKFYDDPGYDSYQDDVLSYLHHCELLVPKIQEIIDIGSKKFQN